MIGPNLSAWAIGSRSLTIYLMIVAIFAGTFAFVGLGRDEDPTFTIKTMLVTAVWPGATMQETQDQLTDRLERRLQETTGLDAVRSITRPGIVTIYVDLDGAFPAEDVAGVWQEVRNRVADIRHTLPQGVVGPFFNDDFGDVFGIIYGFTADGYSHRELRDYVDGVRSALIRDVDMIEKIEFIGAQDEQITIELQPDRVAALGLDYGQVFAAVAAQNAVRPSGTINSGLENLSLRVSGAFEHESDILDVPINAGGRMIRLGDVAEVHRGLVDPPGSLYRVNGKPAIGLGISMREGGDVLELGRQVSKSIKASIDNLPIGIETFLVSNQPDVVDVAINDFTMSLYQAVGIILMVSFLTLGVRPGAVVAIAIPVTLATVFLVMQVMGIDLHRVSLGALIIALALLVDDAMTTVDATLRGLANGQTMTNASTSAYTKLAAPMLTGTLITIAGFVPIGFAQSQAGEYTISLFQVVAIALLASWLVAVVFTPIISSVILKAPAPGASDGQDSLLVRTYSRFLAYAIKARWLTIAVSAGLLVVAVLGLSRVDRQFFPPSDRNELMIDFQLPRSSSIFASEAAIERIETWLGQSQDVNFWSSYIGRNVIRFYLPLAILPPSDHHSQIVVMAKDIDARLRLEKDLENYLTEAFPDAISRVSPLEMGPPIGWPLQWRLSGPDIEFVRDKALVLADLIASDPAADRVHFDWIEPARQLRVEINQDQARRLGLTSQSLAAILQTAVSGSPVTQLRDDIYLVNVVARSPSQDRISLDRLSSLQVPIPGGRTVAMSTFASFSFEQEQPFIWRRDRMPTLTVLADVRTGTPEAVVANIEGKIEELAASLPPGYSIELGGTAETSAESQAAVFAVIPVMIFIMVTLLMIQLRSFANAALVLILLPLGLIGVVGALLLFGRPLGFVAILGILALIGMIAKNAVILIVQINDERSNGLGVRDAAVAAASGRLRPIMLTALSTVLGLIPIAPTLFWGPMAFAIMGGLLVATMLTLILLPVLYITIHDRKPRNTETTPGPENVIADSA